MRTQRFRIALFVLIVLVVGVPAFAQTELQTFTTYDGLVSFNLPAGWVIDAEGDAANLGLFSMASSEEALRILRENSERGRFESVAPGDAGVLIFRSNYLTQTYGIGQPGDSPVDTLQTMFVDQLLRNGVEIQTATVGDYPAAFFTAADETSAGAVYMLDLGLGGVMGFGFSTASAVDYAALEPAFLDMLASVDFGGDAAVHYSPFGFFPVSQLWSPDSQTYALIERYPLGERANTVALYNVSGELIKEAIGLGASWNRDGSQAALYGDSQGSAVEVVDTVTGGTLFTLATAATSVKWSPDDRYIVAGDHRQALRIWDAATGQQLTSLDPAQSWAFNADGTLLAAWNYGGGDVRVIDLSTGAERWTAPRADAFFDTTTGIPEVRWSSDGMRLLVISPEGVPTLVDGATGAVAESYPPGEGMEFKTLVQEGDHLALIYRNEDCRIGDCRSDIASVDLQNGSERFRVTGDDAVASVAWSPDGTRMAAVTSFETLIGSLWDAQTGESLWETRDIDALSTNSAVAWLGDDRLVIRGSDSALPILDAASGEILAMNPGKGSDTLTFNADQSQMLTVDGSIVRVLDSSDGTQIMALPHESDVTRAEWSADESLIYTRMEGGAFAAWDVATGRRLVQINDRLSTLEPDRSLFSFVSPDGEWVLTFLSGSPYARTWPLGARLDAAREAIAAETMTVTDYLDVSDAAGEADDLDGVLAANQAILEIDPDNARAINLIAIVTYRQGDARAALDALNRAVDLDPTFLSSYRNLGDIYRRDNAFEDARAAFEAGLSAAETDADRAVFVNRIGITYSAEERYAEAAEQFTRAIELDATDPVFFRNRGYMYYNQGETFYEQAISDFETYVEMAGNDASAETVELLNTLKGE